MNSREDQDGIFPKGEKASPDYFTGTAWVNILVPKDETGHYAVGNVVFEPGCRNNRHTHPAGQILLITDGHGFYQERGNPARQLLPYVGYPRTLNALKCLNEVIPD